MKSTFFIHLIFYKEYGTYKNTYKTHSSNILEERSKINYEHHFYASMIYTYGSQHVAYYRSNYIWKSSAKIKRHSVTPTNIDIYFSVQLKMVTMREEYNLDVEMMTAWKRFRNLLETWKQKYIETREFLGIHKCYNATSCSPGSPPTQVEKI